MPKFWSRVLLNIWELSITEEHISFMGENSLYWIIDIIFFLNNSYSKALICFLVEAGELCWFILAVLNFAHLSSAVFHRSTVKFLGFYLCTNGIFLFSMDWKKVQPRVNQFSWGLHFDLEEKQRMSHHHLSDAMGHPTCWIENRTGFCYF